MKTLILAGLLAVASSGAAFAYLDPGSGTLILQAIVGVIAGALLIARVYWKRLKNFLLLSFRGKKAADELSSAKQRERAE